MPTSMVLRFRDLVADTIQEHQRLIEDNGYVWWGWWNKPDERIPRHTFAEFQKIIQDKGQLTVFLVDSGRQRLYAAELDEIDSSNTEDAKPCKEPAKTPKYYSASMLQSVVSVYPDEGSKRGCNKGMVL